MLLIVLLFLSLSACENKSRAVEQVKRVFNMVSLGCWAGREPEDRGLIHSPKGSGGGQVLSRP